MSIEAANKSRFERGMMNLTELEGELLNVAEIIVSNYDYNLCGYYEAVAAVKRAYGHD